MQEHRRNLGYHYYRIGRLYSIKMDQSEYTGGAHHNLYQFTFNFDMIEGKPRQLTLSDFFTQGVDYKSLVQGLLLKKLRRLLPNHQNESLTQEELTRFVVVGKGLRFYFDPYEVASYSAGPIDVTLTAAELAPDYFPDARDPGIPGNR